jgi:hypothetical protein
VPTYVVECYLPVATRDCLLALSAQAAEGAARMTARGRAVRYLGSTLIPADEMGFCLFDASSESDVAEASRAAGVSFYRISEALHAPAGEGPDGKED